MGVGWGHVVPVIVISWRRYTSLMLVIPYTAICNEKRMVLIRDEDNDSDCNNEYLHENLLHTLRLVVEHDAKSRLPNQLQDLYRECSGKD